MKELLYCLLVPSANEAANILAEAVDGSVEEFVAHMNRKAGELGCQGTHFVNPHGLHNDDHYTTALDLAHIVKAAMEYDLFRQIVYTSVYETAATNMSAPRTFYNTNGLITQWRFRGYLYDKLYRRGGLLPGLRRPGRGRLSHRRGAGGPNAHR